MFFMYIFIRRTRKILKTFTSLKKHELALYYKIKESKKKLRLQYRKNDNTLKSFLSRPEFGTKY